MSYCKALEAAGATVHEFEEFGSYQGEWWAKVTYNGKTGWVSGAYGSCSGCDAFQSEFGYLDGPECEDHQWISEPPLDCEACKEAARIYNEKLKRFGEEYIDAIKTQEEAIASASEHIEWDMEAKGMVDFIKAHPITGA